jgi:diguanylate cyclase (GGDEF)-like protein/PAS domain S-box-containing protein
MNEYKKVISMEENFQYKEILDKVFDGVYLVNRERQITFWNKGAERITGFQAGIVVGKKCADNILNHINDQGVCLCTDGCPLEATILDGQSRQAEVFLHHAQGHRVPIVLHAEPIKDETGKVIGAVETFTDNSALFTVEKRANRLQEQVDLDALTEIGSRSYIQNILETSLIELRALHSRFGILFLDIDHFKNINDEFGHENGDNVLLMTANSIRHSLRTEDAIGRWSGEEFIAIINEADEKILKAVAEKLRVMILNSLLIINDQLVQVTVSVGGTSLKSEDTPATAIQRANDLMYQSKRNGRNRVTVDTH